MGKTITVISALFISALSSCARPAKVAAPTVQADSDEVHYGDAYGIKVAEDAVKEGKYGIALRAVSEGLWLLRKANIVEKCGTSRVRCIVYKIYGLYLRAMIHAMDDNAEKALEDLSWIHENGYMGYLVKHYQFWKEPRFGSLKDNTQFQNLVRIYMK